MTKRPLPDRKGTLPPVPPEPEGSYVPSLVCLACGKRIDLPSPEYDDFTGQTPRCSNPECRATQSIKIQHGKVTYATLEPNLFPILGQLRDHPLPPELRADFAEAAANYLNRSHKSSVVMCRRVVHGMLLDKDIVDKNSIYEMIEDAFSSGVLQEQERRQAHAIRFFGATGAHPKDPSLRRVDELDALLTVRVTRQILQAAYPIAVQSGTGSSAP